MSSNPSVKILVGYHKKDKLLKDEILVPIHLGRALATEASKDGEMSQEDYQWMLENMIGDDTGENISHLNRIFNEMTGIYWAWKNYDKLGNPDYIGFMHYRRLFDFSEYFKTKNKGILKKLGIEKKTIQNLLKKYNLIFHRKFVFSPEQDIKRIGFDWYQKDIQLSESYYPKLYSKYKLFKADFAFSQYNMFIMRKKDFFAYCETVFDIFFNVYQKNMQNYGKMLYPRYIGYASEYITSFYLDTLKEQEDIEALSVRVRFLYNKITYNLRLLKLWLEGKYLKNSTSKRQYRSLSVHKLMNLR